MTPRPQRKTVRAALNMPVRDWLSQHAGLQTIEEQTSIACFLAVIAQHPPCIEDTFTSSSAAAAPLKLRCEAPGSFS